MGPRHSIDHEETGHDDSFIDGIGPQHHLLEESVDEPVIAGLVSLNDFNERVREPFMDPDVLESGSRHAFGDSTISQSINGLVGFPVEEPHDLLSVGDVGLSDEVVEGVNKAVSFIARLQSEEIEASLLINLQ